MADPRALAQALRDYYGGVGETALSLGSGMAAQIPAGIAGLTEFFTSRNLRNGSMKHALEDAASRVNQVQENLTYEPRGSVGQRGVENVGHAMEAVFDPAKQALVDPIGDRSPAAGAAILGIANVIGPKGKPKAKAHTPRFDPGSPQQLIPGLEPITATEAHARALRNLVQAREAMTFEDNNRGLRFKYDPQWRGSGLGSSQMQPGAWNVENPNRHSTETVVATKRPVSGVDTTPVFRRELDDPGETVPNLSHERMQGETIQANVGQENFNQMQALSERLRAAEEEAQTLGTEAALTRSRDLGQRIERRRALLAEPNIDDLQRRTLEEERLSLMRQRPIVAGGRMLSPDPAEGLFSPLTWRDPLGDVATQEARSQLRQHGLLDAQKRIVRRLRGEPDYIPTSPREPAPSRGSLEEVGGRDPDAMNRNAVADFLRHGKENEALFQYGIEPPQSVRSLEDFARHFSEKSGEPIRVDWDYADSDEPYKIKQKKTHGRGEVMRDRYGDYKGESRTHEAGDYPMYDSRGDLKEVEAKGPTKDGEPLMMKQVAEGGETKYDRYGDNEFDYLKSRGGEVVRDERGRPKYEEVENPDYSGSEVDKATIRGPSGKIDIEYSDPAYISATEARARDKGKAAKGQGGQLLYQTALAHAAREGIDIATGSLTDINTYRLLSNTLSNYARMGKNPREVTGTSSGRATRARGQAEGPELWRAEAEEGRARLLEAGTDPDRVTFDPEGGFSIDGKPASADDIKANMAALSPRAGAGGRLGGVGQKSLMRNAVFEWLRHATPEEAAKVAAKWPKEWGPIFAGIGAATLGIGEMVDSEQQEVATN